eukprot:2200816-Rhodomonas_salina.1
MSAQQPGTTAAPDSDDGGAKPSLPSSVQISNQMLFALSQHPGLASGDSNASPHATDQWHILDHIPPCQREPTLQSVCALADGSTYYGSAGYRVAGKKTNLHALRQDRIEHMLDRHTHCITFYQRLERAHDLAGGHTHCPPVQIL